MESLHSNSASAIGGLASPDPVAAALARESAFPTTDVRLLLPETDVVDPEVSIVIPALNEE
ncbi:MAG TPA: hypothetical protein VLM42_20755, partial [Bryobacteraceae bacterium]|nr:hypothetical protein [Bryobacteraceae bacterium]